MRTFALTFAAILFGAGFAAAQDNAPSSDRGVASSSGSRIGQLLSQGYEIKAAVPNGSRFIVFLQKDKSAYACEFVSVTNSRCGTIN